MSDSLAAVCKIRPTQNVGSFSQDQPERAMRMLIKMKLLKVLPDIKTYELLYSLFGNVNAPYEEGNRLSQVDAARRIHMIERDMEKHGIQHSNSSMKNLLKALGAEGMTTELLQYLNVAENHFYYNNTNPGTPIYNTVLHFLVEAREIVLDYESFDDALNLLDQAKSEGIELDVVIINTILQKACEKGRIDIIECVVERMNREKIQPDPSTCYSVFSAYVNLGFYNTASFEYAYVI